MEMDKRDDAVPENFQEFSGETNNELDLPPEYTHYRDEGCELAESCLHCPFAECIYDEPGGKQRWLKRVRDRKMAESYTNDGKGIKELAQMFGVSQRTVQRALKTTLGNASIRGQKNG